MRRSIDFAVALAVAISLCACKRETASKAAESVLQVKDAIAGKAGARMDEAAIRKLFDEAAACGNRYKCPPADRLLELSEGPEGDLVARVGFDLMMDPAVRSFDRLGDNASNVVFNRQVFLRKHGQFDAAARAQFFANGKRLLAKPKEPSAAPDAPTWTNIAFSMLIAISDDLPAALDLLKQLATDGKRSDDELSRLGTFFGQRDDGFAQAKQWLESADPNVLRAGCSTLDHIDHSKVDQKGAELPMLVAVAKRPKLPKQIAEWLIEHVKGHGDNDFQPALDAFAKYPDSEVQREARDAITAVKQVEAARH